MPVLTRPELTNDDDAAPRSKAGEAAKLIREDILNGRLPPGQKLAFGMLKARYPVGLAPLREALVRLTADRLVFGEEQRGFRVAPISEADLLDITRVSIHLEVEAISSAVAHATPATDMALLQSFHRLEAVSTADESIPSSISDQWNTRHTEFHEALIAACDSPCLLRLRRALFDQSERYRRLSFSFSGGGRNLSLEHRELMIAVLDRNEENARRLVSAHWSRTAEDILRDMRRERSAAAGSDQAAGAVR